MLFIFCPEFENFATYSTHTHFGLLNISVKPTDFVHFVSVLLCIFNPLSNNSLSASRTTANSFLLNYSKAGSDTCGDFEHKILKYEFLDRLYYIHPHAIKIGILSFFSLKFKK